MKLASSFGRYDEEWKEGDWKVKGDVPVIMMLCREKKDGQFQRCATMPQRTGFVPARCAPRLQNFPPLTHHESSFRLKYHPSSCRLPNYLPTTPDGLCRGRSLTWK